MQNELSWRKSSRSESGGCVEVAGVQSAVAVRDSKDPDEPRLTFPRAAWRAFNRRLKTGEHDL